MRGLLFLPFLAFSSIDSLIPRPPCLSPPSRTPPLQLATSTATTLSTLLGQPPNTHQHNHLPLTPPVLLRRIVPNLFGMLLCVLSRPSVNGLQVTHRTCPPHPAGCDQRLTSRLPVFSWTMATMNRPPTLPNHSRSLLSQRLRPSLRLPLTLLPGKKAK